MRALATSQTVCTHRNRVSQLLVMISCYAAINNGLAGCATGLALGWKGEACNHLRLHLSPVRLLAGASVATVATTVQGLTLTCCLQAAP